MKFELNEYHRNIADEEFLLDMQRVAKILSQESLTMSEYEFNGKYHPDSIRRRFGGWLKACQTAGLNLAIKQTNNISIDTSEIIADIKRIAVELNKNSLTAREYDEYGKYDITTIIRKFDGWNNALKTSGLEITLNRGFSKEEMLIDIEDIWIKLGRQPTSTDIKNGASKFSLQSFARRFGGWRGALEAFIEFINIDDEKPYVDDFNSEVDLDKSNEEPNEQFQHKTKRDINLRLRFKIMKRDNFKCCSCGASPAKEPSVELHIDHIVPWSKGGETVIDNLQTLCSKCNLGKSDVF